MKWLVVGSAFLSVLASSCASATSRAPRPLEVHSDGTQILACIPLDEGESVEVADAGVSAVRVKGQGFPKPWGITAGGVRPLLRLAPGECLAYGDVPDGYSSVIPAAELRNEWPYSFAIRSPHWGRHRTRNHSGVFCIRRSAEEVVAVTVPLQSAPVTVDTCRELLDSADGDSDR